jgi:transposase
VALACTLPDDQGRSLAVWDCGELARQLVADGVVARISRETVRRILRGHDLKPWRCHPWLHPALPRDAAFVACVAALCLLPTRPPAPDEVVLSVDEKTSLQPRIRVHATRPAQRQRPVQVEHEYRRDGALHLFAAFDTRTGRVIGQCHRRKRAAEFLAFLAHLDGQYGAEIAHIHLVLDNVATHKTKAVQAWLAAHPRVECHFTPVHCSWLNPVEQWFSLLQRKRLRYAAFASLDDLHLKLRRFISQWNERAHPFAWTSTSVAKVMAKAPATDLPHLEAAEPAPREALAA